MQNVLSSKKEFSGIICFQLIIPYGYKPTKRDVSRMWIVVSRNIFSRGGQDSGSVLLSGLNKTPWPVYLWFK